MDAPAVVGQGSHDSFGLLETEDAGLGGDPFDSDSQHRFGHSHPCLHRVSVPLIDTHLYDVLFSEREIERVSLVGFRATRDASRHAFVGGYVRTIRSAHRTILPNVGRPRPRAFSSIHSAREDARLAADPTSSSLALLRSR